jgi:hypothetical protein
VDPGLLEALERSGRVRWILGRMGVAHGAWSAVIRAEGTTVIKGIGDDGDEGKAELERKPGGFHRVFACSNAVLAAVHVLAQVRE